MHRLAKEYEKPEFGITSVQVGGVEVAVQEQVRAQRPFCRLLRFKRFTDNPTALATMKAQPTVLVVAPLSGHHSTLLRDTVRSLLADHKVYITDWTDARMVPLDRGPLPPRRLRARRAGFHPPASALARARDLGVPAHGAGARGDLLLASAGETTPRSMTMMGGPIDARRSPDRGEQPGDEQEPRLVREQRYLPRAAELPRRGPGACTRASCSTPASWR
jgi:poly(3-hydroxybutyrate) depolymerase